MNEATYVLERTFAAPNNGFQKENSTVMDNGDIHRGKPGPVVTFNTTIALIQAPIIENPQDVECTIHSHEPIYWIWSVDGVPYQKAYEGCNMPSPHDISIFKNYTCNIIVGRLGVEIGERGEGFSDYRKTGIEFYGNDANKPLQFIEYKSLCKIINRKRVKLKSNIAVPYDGK